MTIDELEKEIKALSTKDCLSLLERLGLGEATKMLPAKIRIHDLDQDNRVKPYAVIEYKDGSEESIDIIETVRNNAASIGHPAILLAIHHWEQIVRYHHSFSGNKDYFNLFRHIPLRLKPNETVLKIAETHLSNIGNALLEGIKNRALTKEAVFVMAVCGLGYDREYSYLRLATELLATDELKSINRHEEKLKVLRQKLEVLGDISLVITDEDIEDDEIKERRDRFLINPIIDFFESDEGGKKFLYQNIKLTSRTSFTKLVRPEAPLEFQLPEEDNKWRTIVNKFDAWRFAISVGTVKSYRSNGANQAMNQKSLIRFTPEDDWLINDNEISYSSMEEDPEAFFLSDDGYCEETAVYPSCGPAQAFDEILDTSSLVPDDPECFAFINIPSDLSLPSTLFTYPWYLRPIESWVQAIRTWLVLPSIPTKKHE